MNYETVIGLEVHAQLLTRTKIFCGCSTKFGAEPNENTCPVCLGLPGALPVLNEKAVELAARAAIALQCAVQSESIFARKNYFYPDLPKGYQISQFDRPIAVDGSLEIDLPNERKIIRIKRLHMEEDAGKLLHEGVDSDASSSFVDLNRSGVPLIEIVTEPDLTSPQEAISYLNELKSILQYARVSNANMEEGNLRCDANISLKPHGAQKLGTRVEIKNLNSFKNVQKALEYEIKRQSGILSSGNQVVQETRLFDADRGVTESMRTKEEAHDYRYFPEPDLLPLKIDSAYIEKVNNTIPELPRKKRERFQSEFGLSPADSMTLTEERDLAEYFEEAAKSSGNARQAANWILRDLLKNLKESGTELRDAPVQPSQIAGLVKMIDQGKISGNQGKDVFAAMWKTGKPAEAIVSEAGMTQISGEDEIARFVDDVISRNPDIVNRYRNGELKLLGVLVGEIMKISRGKANPSLVNQVLKSKLNPESE